MRHQWVLKFLEFRKLKRAIGKTVVEAVDLGLNASQFVPDPLDFLPRVLGLLAFPCFNAGKELFLPIEGNGYEPDVSLQFILKILLADKRAVFASASLRLMSATVIVVTTAALLFSVPFASDGKTAGSARREIEKEKSLTTTEFAGPANSDQCLLNIVKRLLGNHGQMHPLVEFTFVLKNPVIERVGQHLAD